MPTEEAVPTEEEGTPLLGSLRSELNTLFINKSNAARYRRHLEDIDRALGLDTNRYFPDNAERIAAIEKLKSQ